jgi:DNA-binding response OmpR family regulator
LSARFRILAVDPDEEERSLVEATARALGSDCDWCGSGQEALGRISANSYDAILIDVLLPDDSGYELCRAVKSDPETADVPLLFATPANHADDVLDGFQTLAFDYLLKPYRPRELHARLRNALRTKALLDEMRRRARSAELVIHLGRALAQAATAAEAERSIERELAGLSETLGAEGISVEIQGKTLCAVGSVAAPVAADIPFDHPGIDGVLRVRRSTPADSEERMRLADFSGTLARGLARHRLAESAG